MSIGRSAFFGYSDLTSVTIPNSVTSINQNAFNCNGLTRVTFATGSNISSSNFGIAAFPQGYFLDLPVNGDSLRTAYLAGGAGTYTRAADGSTWTRQ
jgi:hypothetical protein